MASTSSPVHVEITGEARDADPEARKIFCSDLDQADEAVFASGKARSERLGTPRRWTSAPRALCRMAVIYMMVKEATPGNRSTGVMMDKNVRGAGLHSA